MEQVYLKAACPEISYEYFVSHVHPTMVDTLRVAFKGKYRDGAAGRPDAGYMKGIVVTGIEVWDPVSVIVDLSELEYEWGDNINTVFAAVARMKCAIIVSYKNRRGLSMLEFGTHTREDLVDDDFFFDDLEKAIKKLKYTT